MRVYLSGPMTGHKDWNYPAFHAAAKALREQGHTVYNPAENSRDPDLSARESFLRDDLKLLAGTDFLPADAIALLPGWQASAGARMELHVALELGLTVFALTTDHLFVLAPAESWRAQLLDAVVNAWAPKEIEIVETGSPRPPLNTGDWSGVSTLTSKESILQEAQRLVHGDRGVDYGHPIEDFTRTAALATAQFRDLLRDGAVFTFREVWQFMCLVKLSRERNRPKRDNRVDLAGYAETGQMCEDESAKRKEAA